MIEFKNVSFRYPHEGETIKNVSFSVGKGEFVALVGQNGAGKSTVLKLINGILKPSEGNVFTSGLDTALTPVSKIASHIGFLFQNPDRQICCPTVREEILFSLNTLKGISNEEKQKRLKNIMDIMGFNGDESTFSMSRGEKQKTSLASALASEPEILVLDEPTTGLDYKECIQIMDFVKKLNEEKNITVFMVCHDMEVVLDYAHRIIAFANGEIVGDGRTEDIFKNKYVLEKASLLPPQIIELSMALGGEFENCKKAEEVIDVIKNRKEL